MPGLFFTEEDVVNLHKDLRRMPPVEVSEELRGWSYGAGVVSPPGGPLLGVSDVTGGFCDRGRDVYLRYARRVPQRDNAILQRGRLIHEVWMKTIVETKKAIYSAGLEASGNMLFTQLSSFKEKLKSESSAKYKLLDEGTINWIIERIVNEGAATYSSALDRQLSRSRFMEIDGVVAAVVPLLTEFPVSGERIGLSRALRIDALLPPNLILELKTRNPRREFELTLAGYAMAFESQYEFPVDHGILIYIEVDPEKRRLYVRPKILPIGDSLRSEFIDRRDKLVENILYDQDPGLSSNCPPDCPYLYYCRGGADEPA
ncbi:MAG: type I-A CRISPR-associated protein Cas4/Csa1 [Infirmifilum sp.]